MDMLIDERIILLTREREKHWCERDSSHMNPDQDEAHNLGVSPDWESNLQRFGIQDNTATNWATRPGLSPFFATYVRLHLYVFYGNQSTDLYMYSPTLSIQ